MMLLGKRNAEDALLPMTNDRSTKRKSPTSDDGSQPGWLWKILPDTLKSTLGSIMGDVDMADGSSSTPLNGHAPRPLEQQGTLLNGSATKVPLSHLKIPRQLKSNGMPPPEAGPSAQRLPPQNTPQFQPLSPPTRSGSAYASTVLDDASGVFKTPGTPASVLYFDARSDAPSPSPWRFAPKKQPVTDLHLSDLRTPNPPTRNTLFSSLPAPSAKPPQPFVNASANSRPLPDSTFLSSRNSNRSVYGPSTRLTSSQATSRANHVLGGLGQGVRAVNSHRHIHQSRHQKQVNENNRRFLQERYQKAVDEGYSQSFDEWVDFEDYKKRIYSLEEKELLAPPTAATLNKLKHPPSLTPSLSVSRASSYTPFSPSESSRSRRTSFGSAAASPAPSYASELSVSTVNTVRMGREWAGAGLSSTRAPDLFKRPESRLPKASDGAAQLLAALAKAKAAINAPRPPEPDTEAFKKLEVRDKAKELELQRKIRRERRKKLPASLPPHQASVIESQLRNPGFKVKVAREQVGANDIGRLLPAQWLNDEIINFWGALLMERSERYKKAAKEGKGKEKEKAPADEFDLGTFGHSEPLPDIHYFNTYLFAKMEKPGYEAAKLNKWTKTVDIFAKSVLLIPVNIGNMHWTCAAINMKKKRIEYYDSMGTRREKVYKLLREYLQKEHMDKKKKDFDFTGWEDYFSEETPQQENGYDCGVFTCMFMEGLSRGEEPEDFCFDQTNMAYLRRRIMWEIGRAKLP